MTATMTNQELTEKVGKKFFLADDQILLAKLNYESGILSFDNYLNGKTLKEINAVIHISKYPKGLVIKIAKLFSSFPFGLSYSEIQRTVLSETKETAHLIFETTDNGKIVFALKTGDVPEVKKYLEEINLKYTFETTVVAKKQPQKHTVKETVQSSTYRKKYRK